MHSLNDKTSDIRFSNFIPFEVFVKYVRQSDLPASLKNVEAAAKWQEHITEPAYRFIESLVKAGRIQNCQNGLDHGIKLSRFLEAIRTQDVENTDLIFAKHNIGYMIVENSLFFLRSKDRDLQDDYNAICETMDSGNIPSQLLCEVGKSERIEGLVGGEFKDWKLELSLMEFSASNERVISPLPQVDPPEIQHQVIKAPSGRILLSDFFEFDAIEEIVGGSEDVNLAHGRMKSTERMAREHNIMDIAVGNSDPYIYEIDGTIILGRPQDFDSTSNPDDSGQVYTGRWCVMGVDYEVLLNMLSQSMDETQARNTLDQYIEENEVSEVRIDPGELHFYYQSHPRLFTDLVPDHALGAPGVEPFFVFSDHELDLSPASRLHPKP